MKKLLKTGMIAATALPVAAIISCSDSESGPKEKSPYEASKILEKTSKDNLDDAFTAAEAISKRDNTLKLEIINGNNQPVSLELFDESQWKRSVRIMSQIAKEIVDDDVNKIGVSADSADPSATVKVGITAKDLIEKFNEKGYTMLDVVVKSSTAGSPGWKQYGIVVETPKVAALKEKLVRYDGKTVDVAFEKMFTSITGEEVTTNTTTSGAWDTTDTMSVTVNELDHNQTNFGVAEWSPNLVKSYIFELELKDPVVNEEHGILTRFSNFLIVNDGSTRATDFSVNHGSGAGSILAPVNNNNVGTYSWT